MGAYVLVLVNMPLMEFELCMFLPLIKNALRGPRGIGGRRQNTSLLSVMPQGQNFLRPSGDSNISARSNRKVEKKRGKEKENE